MKLFLVEQMELTKPWFQDTKNVLVTSAKGKEDCKNWDRHFLSLCLIFDIRKMSISIFHIKTTYRSSGSQMFFLKVILKNFSIFTRIQLCWSLPLIKLQGWRPVTLSKGDSNTGFSCEYCEIFRNTFFTAHPR